MVITPLTYTCNPFYEYYVKRFQLDLINAKLSDILCIVIFVVSICCQRNFHFMQKQYSDVVHSVLFKFTLFPPE